MPEPEESDVTTTDYSGAMCGQAMCGQTVCGTTGEPPAADSETER